MTLPICCVTGRIAGDKDACGDCDPCGAAYSVPEPVKALLKERDEWAEKYSDAMCELDELRAAAASAEPVGYGYSAEIQSAPGQALHVCRERVGIYDTPLYTHPAPDAEIVTALERAAHLANQLSKSDSLAADGTRFSSIAKDYLIDFDAALTKLKG